MVEPPCQSIDATSCHVARHVVNVGCATNFESLVSRLEWIGVKMTAEMCLEEVEFTMHFTLMHHVPTPPIAEAFMRGQNPIKEKMAAHTGFGKWWADTQRVLFDLRQLASVELCTWGHRVCLNLLGLPKPKPAWELQRIRAYVEAEFDQWLCKVDTGPPKLSIDNAWYTWGGDPELTYV